MDAAIGQNEKDCIGIVIFFVFLLLEFLDIFQERGKVSWSW